MRRTRLIGLLVVLLGWPAWAGATVDWDDEFTDLSNWYTGSAGSGVFNIDSTTPYSGTTSLRVNYPPVCYPDGVLIGFQCGGGIFRGVPSGLADFYQRVYVRFSANWQPGDTETKLLGLIPDSHTYSIWWLTSFNTMNLAVEIARNLTGTAMRASTTYTIPRNTWVCLETREKRNTLGNSDGILQAWINGGVNPIINLSGQEMLTPTDTSPSSLVGAVELYRQVGSGDIWWDRYAVGNTRIFCDGAPSTDIPPGSPAPPVNFRVN